MSKILWVYNRFSLFLWLFYIFYIIHSFFRFIGKKFINFWKNRKFGSSFSSEIHIHNTAIRKKTKIVLLIYSEFQYHKLKKNIYSKDLPINWIRIGSISVILLSTYIYEAGQGHQFVVLLLDPKANPKIWWSFSKELS